MMNIVDIAKELPPWVLLGLGAVAGGLRSAWSFIYTHTIGYAITRLTLSLTVEDSEHREAYLWLTHWGERNLRLRHVHSLLLRRQDSPNGSQLPAEDSCRLIPEYGTYYLIWKKRLMVLTHSKETRVNPSLPKPVRTMRLQIWFAWDRALLLAILAEARESFDADQSMTVEYYRADNYGDWRMEAIAPRSMDSVYLPPEQEADLMADIESFLLAKTVFAELGIPYRRGYQLAGPPGTGKSTLILAIASKFRLPVYAIGLRGGELNGTQLADLMASCRKPAIVAFEDLDSVNLAAERHDKAKAALTMAELLNAIDGIGASEDRLLFITANRPELLDEALVRAGRVDRKFFIGYARDEELQRFHNRLEHHFPIEPWATFRAGLPARATIADAQAHAFRGREETPETLMLQDHCFVRETPAGCA